MYSFTINGYRAKYPQTSTLPYLLEQSVVSVCKTLTEVIKLSFAYVTNDSVKMKKSKFKTLLLDHL